MVEELTKKRSEIDAALVRIADGTYGFCTSCKDLIDTDRLAILPTAILCLSCEQKKKSVLQVK
jgi:DnaK suppressor protein